MSRIAIPARSTLEVWYWAAFGPAALVRAPAPSRGAHSPGVRPIGAPGAVAGGTSPSVILTGSFTVGSLTGSSTETLSGAWTPNGSGGFKINGGSAKVITNTTETSTDPYVGFSPLTLTASSSVPEPASLCLIGLAVPALLSRRRA